MQVSDLGGIFPSVINACIQYKMLALPAHWGHVLFCYFCVNAWSVCEQGYKCVSESNTKYLIESFALVCQQAAWGDCTT